MNATRMTQELFNQLTQNNDWIFSIASPVSCCDKFYKFLHFRTVTYPESYIVSKEQVEQAKQMKEEIIKNLRKELNAPGTLVLLAKGGFFSTNQKNGIGNHNVFTTFKNQEGRKFFVSFITGKNGDETCFYIDFSYDRDLEEQRRSENSQRQDYTNAMGIAHTCWNKAYTFDNILELVNKVFGCDYKRVAMTKYIKDEVCSFC